MDFFYDDKKPDNNGTMVESELLFLAGEMFILLTIFTVLHFVNIKRRAPTFRPPQMPPDNSHASKKREYDANLKIHEDREKEHRAQEIGAFIGETIKYAMALSLVVYYYITAKTYHLTCEKNIWSHMLQSTHPSCASGKNTTKLIVGGITLILGMILQPCGLDLSFLAQLMTKLNPSS